MVVSSTFIPVNYKKNLFLYFKFNLLSRAVSLAGFSPQTPSFIHCPYFHDAKKSR